MPRRMIGKETTNKLIGGAIGGLIFHLDEAAKQFLPQYPAILAQKLDARLPRNGALVADLAPLGIAWGIEKGGKRRREKASDMVIGITAYDVPKLIHQFMVNFAANLGATGSFQTTRMTPSGTPVPMFFGPTGGGVTSAAPQTQNGTGRYRIVQSVDTTPRRTGTGKYTVS